MSIDKWKFAMTHLFLSVFLILYNAAISLAATSSKVTQNNNPFRSLLPEKNNSVSLPQSLSKPVSTTTKSPSQGKKKGTEKAAHSNSAAQLTKLKTSSRTDISSLTKQITETLSMKDILETSEGPYAFIDEKKYRMSSRKESGWKKSLSRLSIKIARNCRKLTERQTLS